MAKRKPRSYQKWELCTKSGSRKTVYRLTVVRTAKGIGFKEM